MNTEMMHLSVHIDQARVDRIIERGLKRMRRLSRKKRKAERRHIENQLSDCVAKATFSIGVQKSSFVAVPE